MMQMHVCEGLAAEGDLRIVCCSNGGETGIASPRTDAHRRHLVQVIPRYVVCGNILLMVCHDYSG